MFHPADAKRCLLDTHVGTSCSIQIGDGLTDGPAGSLRNVFLVVTDLEAVRTRLLERGVGVSEIRHKTPIGAWDGGFAPGLDSARGDYASFANFSDPDGNSWVLQERGYRNGRPIVQLCLSKTSKCLSGRELYLFDYSLLQCSFF